jgi:hypothetical protein
LSVNAGRCTLDPDPAEVRVVIETRHGLLVEAVRRGGGGRADQLFCDLG